MTTDASKQNEETIKTLKIWGYIKGNVSSFRSLEAAQNVRDRHSVKSQMIVMGDNEWYWLVSPADAQRLEQGNYELI